MMSVVAVCLPFDGVLLVADTRITYTRSDGTRLHADHAQKVFAFAPGTAIGFVGRVDTASALLQALIKERDRRLLSKASHRRLDPTHLFFWIPDAKWPFRFVLELKGLEIVTHCLYDLLLDNRSGVLNLLLSEKGIRVARMPTVRTMARCWTLNAGSRRDLEVLLALRVWTLTSKIAVLVGTDGHADPVSQAPQAAKANSSHWKNLTSMMAPDIKLVSRVPISRAWWHQKSGKLFYSLETKCR